MAISGFGRGKGEGYEGPVPAPPTSSGSSSSSASNLSAFIDQGSTFEGKLTFKDTVRIDGCFTGEISSENTLIVGESGEINATIRSTTVVVSGVVTGNIHATRQVVLHKTGKVDGDIETPSIIVEEGAAFNGSIAMGKPAKDKAPLKAVGAGQDTKTDKPMAAEVK